jgi:purine-binding chemotaxis protein CheW
MESSANASDRSRVPRDPRQPAITTAIETLIFELSGSRFALPMCDVIEVVRAVAIRTLPAAPPITLGIIDVRGEVVPVLDVRVRFGLSHKSLELSDQFLIAYAGARRVALHVDAAIGLQTLTVLAVEDATNLPRAVEHVAGIAATDEGLVLIHDLKAFLTQSEALTLDSALEHAQHAAEPAAE